MEDGGMFCTRRERRQTSRMQLRRAAVPTIFGALCADALVFVKKARVLWCAYGICAVEQISF